VRSNYTKKSRRPLEIDIFRGSALIFAFDGSKTDRREKLQATSEKLNNIIIASGAGRRVGRFFI